ncbi:NADP-dependent oxidoreductase [Cryobacterium roopkundense]|uniref:NADPH:quinone reductase-like Zn-dependent oxidoreductase n=1 Tax=Cryobacterium roopkundense TaxID=1001240 RepID=A0A7W8ZZ89_9MICO|nr:NADP-dependent oxidoreductase [Cryobacterium roopkundense]MBB5642692.1 NADPH:quinone reductase-like Zn-dependent oxidoreductase [Cryobacterium roopkundense]
MTDLPKYMRALVIDRPGAADELHLADVPLPVPVLDELLVRVVAAGVNPIDAKTRAGGGVSAAITGYPVILGNDFSGVVVRAPYAAFPLQPGDAVYGMARVPRTGGTYAEYVAVSALSVARKPARLSHTEAAALPVAALTAWGMVVDMAEAAPGQRMLIHAGSGGVGHLAVQFAASLGVHVTATGSTGSLEFLRELGAAEVIDYSTTRFEDVVHDLDAVIDLIGNVHDATGSRSMGVLRAGGILVNAPTGSWPTMQADAAAAGIRSTGYKVSADARALDRISALMDSGAVRVHIDTVFDLTDGAAAHRAVEGGHTRGKVVLRVSD